MLSEDELALINALQLRPRASWAELEKTPRAVTGDASQPRADLYKQLGDLGLL
ncbi:hypothetical protein AB0N16_13090 [Streptomyces sp. NPDC051105]|uniref:hypothetical protein n=1 Tax=Streptomyces sp. NPDC051105 TaxID=3154843 RepID=UPI00342BA30F